MQPNEVAKRNAEVFLRSLSQTDLDPRVVCGPHGEIHVRLFCTRDLRNEHHVAERIIPRMSMLDMARYAGWWGYEKPVDQGCEFDAKRVLIEEPSEAFVVRHGLSVMAHGIRAEESSARKKHVSFRGNLYQGADRTWYLMPIGHWALEDVWAYIASRELRYHASYDAMTNARVPRDAQRVARMLGERGSGWGRHAILRAAHPEQWHALVREFPRFALDS